MWHTRRGVAVVGAAVLLLLAAYGGWALVTKVSGASAAPTAERPALHERMRAIMDAMMGSGAADRMRAAMPGSEAMLEACTQAMGGMAGDGRMVHGRMGADMMHDPVGGMKAP